MSKNYAIINGVRLELPDDIGELTFTVKSVEEEKQSPFERVDKKRNYFFITRFGEIQETIELGEDFDDKRFAIANYCTDKTIMEQRALHETLNRLLWRYSEEHNGDSEWNGENIHWFITKDFTYNKFRPISTSSVKDFGAVHFYDEETAQAAINEIVKPFMAEHPDFVW